MADDYSLPSKQRLINLINDDNGSSLTEQQVTFSNPEVWNEYGRNTRVLLTANPESGLSGTRYFYYNRLNISVLLNQLSENDFYVRVDEPTTTYDLLNDILSRYGVFLSSADVRQDPILPGATSALIRTRANSYGWVGQVSVSILPTIPELTDLIEFTGLTGFNYEPQWPTYANADLFIEDEAQLLALVNSNNNTTFTFDDVEFSELTATAPDIEGRNTSIKMTAKPNRPVTGEITLTYRRVDIGVAYPAGFELVVDVNTLTTTHEVLAALITEHGVALDVGEVTNEPLAVFPTSSILTISNASFVWAPGSELNINHASALEYELSDSGYYALSDSGYPALSD